MSDSTTGGAPVNGSVAVPEAGATPAAEPSLADVVKQLGQLTEKLSSIDKLDGKIGDVGKGLARLREKFKSAADESPKDLPQTEPAPAAAPAGVSRDEITAARKLERVMGGLNDKAKQHLESLLDNGKSYADVFALAQTLSEFAQPAGQPATGTNGQTTPRGHGATPAPSQTAGPVSQMAARKMKATPEGAEKLRAWMNEGGDVSKLPIS